MAFAQEKEVTAPLDVTEKNLGCNCDLVHFDEMASFCGEEL